MPILSRVYCDSGEILPALADLKRIAGRYLYVQTPISFMAKAVQVSSPGNKGGAQDEIQFKYLVPPHKTSLVDIMIVIIYHMLPFTSIPVLLNCLLLWWGTR